jgi:uncharacterized protein (TIGR03067 family)
MKLQLPMILLLGACLAGQLDAGGKEKSDKEKLQGSWSAAKGEKTLSMQFKGDSFTVIFDGKERFEGTFKIDPTKKPRAIDMKVQKTTDPNNKYVDKISLGIYEVEGETLKWCANEPGRDVRPTEFAEKSGDQKYLFIVLKREKK